MSENKYKFFSKSDINYSIKKVEYCLFNRKVENNYYILLDKLRYCNVNSIVGKLKSFDFPGIFTTFNLSYLAFIKVLYRILFDRVQFESSADIIHIRNNLSIFFFKEGCRVKIFLDKGVRKLEEFRNEYSIRLDLEKNDTPFAVPALLSEHIDLSPACYCDEVV